jgi:hypothetical protein
MRSRRLSFFAVASWLVPFFVFLMMMPYVDAATERERRSFFPGLVAFIIQLSVTAGLAFILGLLSFLRRERVWWVAAIPAVPGGLFLGWLVFVTQVWNRIPSAILAIQRSADLTAGSLMVLIGVFFLACLLPRARARVPREQEADGGGEKDARSKAKEMKLFGIATLIVGVAFILIYALELL